MQVCRAEEWYSTKEYADGVTHIFEPYINIFYRCNMWHVRGRERNLLFDSGSGVVSLLAQVPWLAAPGLMVVASHTHFDHIGSHHEFPNRACHVSESEIMASPSPERTLAARYATLDMFERLPPGGFRAQTYRVRAAAATRLLQGGDVIDLGDRHFEVIHVPGHSPGSIALWEPATGVLLSGDAVYDGPLIDDAYHSNREDYIATMRRLRQLPVRAVHGGHYPSFGRERYHELIDDYVGGRRAPGCPNERNLQR
ncbi:MAG: MBL fold metallo-hydrolase [Pseudomonadota bacterium]|nr:MBL fold metallo-hydrolase [Pseudomonadota bacterium]